MKPLVCRAPDGRRYLVPSTPRYPATPRSPRATEDAASGPEPTSARPDRRPTLTAEDVRAIRADYAADKWSQGDLAYMYGLTQSTISAAISGDTHVTTGPTPREKDS